MILNKLLLKLDQLGFQPSKQQRLEISGLIFQSIVVYNLLLTLDKSSKQEVETGASWTDTSVYH